MTKTAAAQQPVELSSNAMLVGRMLLASEPPAMEAYRVSRAVNTPRNNSEALLQPVPA